MRPRVAIPVPHSDEEYAGRSLPQYERAVEQAGGEPVSIALEGPRAAIERMESCQAVVLPGSKADVEPAKYGGLPAHPKTAAADTRRDAIDRLLLEAAYQRRKPVLGICYGLQSLNVFRSGSLIQHIESPVNHAAGRKVAVAHTVEVEPASRLREIIAEGVEKTVEEARLGDGKIIIPVNSSHHQSAERVGEGLRIVARCPEDGIIEALEGTSPDHFVLAVQWHPERSVEDEGPSRALFRALVEAARGRQAELEPSSV